MREKIFNWVGKHKRVHFILRCLRRINDRDFVHDCMHLEDDHNIIRLTQNGEKHKGEILYRIDINFYNGFCAIFRYVLLQMYLADSWGGYQLWFQEKNFPIMNPMEWMEKKILGNIISFNIMT